MIGKVVVGMIGGYCSLFVKFAVKFVPALRKRVKPCNPLEINEMVRFLGILERVPGWISPTVWLGTKVGQFSDRMPQKPRHFSGNFFGSHAIYV